MAANKPPVDKLPIAVRKNVRDEWESKKPELEARLTSLLGIPWTFDINPLAVYPYGEPGSFGRDSLGACIYGYVEGFIRNAIEEELPRQGDSFKDELNFVASTHTITLVANEKVTYCGVDFEAGVLRLLFNPSNLGSNVSNVGEKLPQALSSAPQPPGAPVLSFAARSSIQKDYDPEIGEILADTQRMLQNTAFRFEPDFDAVFTALKKAKGVRDDWQTNFGSFMKEYLKSLPYQLREDKFEDDDMLREGFADAVDKGVLRVRVVEKIKRNYNEIVVEGGELVIQTTPTNWGTNIDYACNGLVDLL